ncbi:MAG TPA: MFS transporter [Kribbellaceae bacterium]|jgi:predicted MFS family arabinose efflux permease
MTTACEPAPVLTERILSPRFARLLVAAAGSGLSFYLLLSVVPLYVATSGSVAGAGLTTGVLLLSTVVVELAMTALIARFGYRSVIAAGLVLLGAPAALLPLTAALPLVLAVCVARGAGLAVMFVAGTALTAELVPPSRRGEGLGLYGVVVGVPAVVGLPAGVYLSGRIGFGTVFLLAAVTALAGLVAVSGLPGRDGRPAAADGHAGLFRGPGLRTAVVFAVAALAAGVVVTFLPLAVSPARGRLVAGALFVQALLAPVSRWLAGWYGDRRGHRHLLVPALLLTATGVAALSRFDSAVAVLAGMVAFGIGFGAAQSITLGVMFDQAGPGAHGRISALWNLAYDLGMGGGALAFGLLVGTGITYPTAFTLTAVLLVASVGVVVRDRG